MNTRRIFKERTHRVPALSCLLAAACSAACASTPKPAPEQRTADHAPLPPSHVSAAPTAPVQGPTVLPPILERRNPDDDFRSQPPKPEPEQPVVLPVTDRFRLKNGVPVILLSDRRLPLVHAQMLIRTGSAADPKGRAGLAELCANMLDEGTTSRSAIEIAEAIDQLGATLTTSASWDYSAVAVSALSESFGAALAIWADVLKHPVFAESELDRVRDNLLAQLARKKDSPPAIASDLFNRVLYGDGHPFAWPSEGTEESLRRIGVSDLREFFTAYYGPRNAVLVVAGDIDQTELRAAIEPLLSDWQGRTRAPPRLPRPTPGRKLRVVLVDKPGAPQSSIRVGLDGLARKHADYHAALVMNEILGGTFRRLDLNLRERRGWTYGARSRFSFRRAGGPWFVSGEFVADKTADSVQEIVSEIRTLREADVPAQELAEAKSSITRAFPARFATVRSAAAQFAELAIHDLPASELAQFQKKIDAVTAADVRRVARALLRDEQIVVTVVGDRGAHEKVLRTLGAFELRDLDGRPLPP